ncbi:hypothetical protein B0H16DRAFT_1550918 [Mycena metata]|uniref:Uncharacterized protein n=1 Tax=Mycena metata TaxID=1033252 RepID=A0AAD7N8Y6_9AGAR|nr:hypothetical protein B0H16DRAFT_1550918 [Mycena metata]
MTPEELLLIRLSSLIFTSGRVERNFQGVKKTVEGLRAVIPSITGKMVRSVVMETPTPEDKTPKAPRESTRPLGSSQQPRSVKDMSPREAEAYAEKHRNKIMKQVEAAPKRPAFLKQTEMMMILQVYGESPSGKYGLLARGNTVYEFEQMFWVNVVKGDPTITTLFERLKIEAILGHKEAVWMLWGLLKAARNDTAEGIRLIKDEHIAHQLDLEFGANPSDLDADLTTGVGPGADRLAELLRSIKDGYF